MLLVFRVALYRCECLLRYCWNIVPDNVSCMHLFFFNNYFSACMHDFRWHYNCFKLTCIIIYMVFCHSWRWECTYWMYSVNITNISKTKIKTQISIGCHFLENWYVQDNTYQISVATVSQIFLVEKYCYLTRWPCGH